MFGFSSVGRSFVARSVLIASFGASQLLSLSHCSRKKDDDSNIQPKADVQAPAYIADSFVVEKSSNNDRKDKVKVGIKKAALEKEFLFQTSMVDMLMFPTFTGMKSRVVAFSKHDGSLFMLEATQGHTVTNELPQKFVLAEFPILSETDEVTFFDFNAGMSRIFLAGDWGASDFSGAFYQGDSWQSVKLGVSFLEDAGANQSNNLVISQFAQMNLSRSNGSDINNSVMMKYYLSPYAPNPNFEPTKSTNFEHVGYFEVAPQLSINTASASVYASKYDLNKKIVYAISSNTPAEYKQAVKDGILYWNKTLGAGKIEVIDAPDGVSAPDFDHNIVQWVTFDAAGFAYADAQMDPRSGETLHAQVFLTSAFAASGKAQARAILRKFDSESTTRHMPINGLKLAGFESSLRCTMEMSQKFRSSLADALLRPDTTDDEILKMTQDYIREVTAHEIGHTLGLRHNFAGTLATNFPLSIRNTIFKQYVESGSTPAGVIPSSSVMDYHLFQDSAMIGDIIAKGPSVLAYDDMALQHLYYKKPIDEANAPYFCTDSHMGVFADCQVFDIGASHVEFATWDESDTVEGFPAYLMERFISARFPGAGANQRPFESVAAKPEIIANFLLWDRDALISSLSDSLQLIRTYRSYPYVNSLNLAEVKAAQHAYVEKEFARFGGVDKMLASFPQKFGSQVLTKFTELANSDAYRRGVGAGGQRYEFTQAEIDRMVAIVAKMMEQLTPALVSQEIAGLRRAEQLVDGPLSDAFAAHMEARAKDVIFASSGETEYNIEVLKDVLDTSSPRETITVKLPNYVYNVDTRAAASNLLAARGLAPEWGTTHLYNLQAAFQAHILKSITKPLDKFTIGLMPKLAGRWVAENRVVQTALTAPALNAKTDAKK